MDRGSFLGGMKLTTLLHLALRFPPACLHSIQRDKFYFTILRPQIEDTWFVPFIFPSSYYAFTFSIFFCISIQSSSDLVCPNFGSDDYMINFTTDKNSGLIDIDQRRLQRHTLIGRKCEASCALIPTICGTSFSGRGLNDVSGVCRQNVVSNARY
jgi:hypothetical protein